MTHDIFFFFIFSVFRCVCFQIVLFAFCVYISFCLIIIILPLPLPRSLHFITAPYYSLASIRFAPSLRSLPAYIHLGRCATGRGPSSKTSVSWHSCGHVIVEVTRPPSRNLPSFCNVRLHKTGWAGLANSYLGAVHLPEGQAAQFC